MIPSISAYSEFRMIRAVVDFGDRRVLVSEAITHLTRQMIVRPFVKKTSSDAGLIGDDDDVPAQIVDREACQFKNPGLEFELVRMIDISTIYIDDAVSIEKEGTRQHDVVSEMMSVNSVPRNAQ
jgi:hypothetical protein